MRSHQDQAVEGDAAAFKIDPVAVAKGAAYPVEMKMMSDDGVSAAGMDVVRQSLVEMGTVSTSPAASDSIPSASCR